MKSSQQRATWLSISLATVAIGMSVVSMLVLARSLNRADSAHDSFDHAMPTTQSLKVASNPPHLTPLQGQTPPGLSRPIEMDSEHRSQVALVGHNDQLTWRERPASAATSKTALTVFQAPPSPTRDAPPTTPFIEETEDTGVPEFVGPGTAEAPLPAPAEMPLAPPPPPQATAPPLDAPPTAVGPAIVASQPPMIVLSAPPRQVAQAPVGSFTLTASTVNRDGEKVSNLVAGSTTLINGAEIDNDLQFTIENTQARKGELIVTTAQGQEIAKALVQPNVNRYVLHGRITPFDGLPAAEIKVEFYDSDTTQPIYLVGKRRFEVDLAGPQLVDARLSGNPTAGPEIRLSFRDNDLNSTSISAATVLVHRIGATGIYAPVSGGVLSPGSEIVLGEKQEYLAIKYSSLAPGVYRVTLPADSGLVDNHGNHSGGRGATGGSQEKLVEVIAPAVSGKQIQFPELLPTAPQPEFARRPNPGDKVETAVVRLYYFRDAHRVAQLVNRSAESLRRAAVTVAEQNAEEARRKAETATIDRREAEREAVRKAEDLRAAEARLAESRQSALELTNRKLSLSQSKAINEEQIRLNTARSEGLQDGEEKSRLEQQNQELSLANAQIAAQISTIDTEVAKLNLDETNVARLQNSARAENEKSLKLADQEEQLIKNQFRLEVAAATEDPDTYAAADLRSVDPVAQVSVSVIGEGLIQLRGPSKGIDAIRTMIHQIDAPVGQIKVDVTTVQVNGEDGRRMEKPVGKIDAYLKISRGLTSHSLMMLRRAVQEEAQQIAILHDSGGHYQVDRDLKYLYAFFGRDFVDELYEMDSEFLDSENKILGLHSMDTISLHQALFVLALAKNDVRQRILANFMNRVHSDLIDVEFDMHRSLELLPHKTHFWKPHHSREHLEAKVLEGISLNNAQRYHFTHLTNFLGAINASCSDVGYELEGGNDTLNPVQREFIRLAQIFKSRLVAELELKQRLIERTMIEDNVLNEIQEEEEAANSIRQQVLNLSRELQTQRLLASQTLVTSRVEAETAASQILDNLQLGIKLAAELRSLIANQNEFESSLEIMIGLQPSTPVRPDDRKLVFELTEALRQANMLASFGCPRTKSLAELQGLVRKRYNAMSSVATGIQTNNDRELLDGQANLLDAVIFGDDDSRKKNFGKDTFNEVDRIAKLIDTVVEETTEFWTKYRANFTEFAKAAAPTSFQYEKLVAFNQALQKAESTLLNPSNHRSIFDQRIAIFCAAKNLAVVDAQYVSAKEFLRQTRSSLERRKLLDFLIQEQEEKVIDLLEGTRSRIAAIDGYLKRMMIALEDDFESQFYDPAFVHIRAAARHNNVAFSQVERTSVLTNNRAFAKVSPQATMEFDLPKRKIAIVEALDGAKAIAQDYGALLQDPTFLAAFQMLGGAPSNGMTQKVLPGLPSSGDQQQMGFTTPEDQQSGAALQSLVPDPSIYKIETGTGYEIRPVIQPDGISVVYDFNYMYTTNIREPVRADEKHLGRVKRHFIHTQVQTTSFEMRKVSRYRVALKASRTSQGVPLLQDIPAVGALFRPAPSAESALQENIILSQTVVYPTVFDIMGLRWAPSVVDLNHLSVREGEHVVRGRQQTVKNSVFENTTRTVDDVLGLNREGSKFNRPDLYHKQTIPSPYHPGGYVQPGIDPDQDPSGRGFMHRERRPSEMQNPPYDNRRRVPVTVETTMSDQLRIGEPIGIDTYPEP